MKGIIDLKKTKDNLEEILWLRHYSDPQTISEADKETERIDVLEKELIEMWGITFQKFQEKQKVST